MTTKSQKFQKRPAFHNFLQLSNVFVRYTIQRFQQLKQQAYEKIIMKDRFKKRIKMTET